ncbi:MAG: RluA family pseudouridine synthase [Eubacterium sp.]|nr:RluA family pseudouridine synthase [Eubacterium sp.]
MIEIHIDSSTASQRLDKFLRRYLPEAGSGFLYKQLRKKNITLNHTRASGSELLRSGDAIQIFFSEETLHKFMGTMDTGQDYHCATAQNTAGSISCEKGKGRTVSAAGGPSTGPGRCLCASDILFENTQVLVLNKRAGILSQKADPDDYSLVEMLQAYLWKKGELSEERLRLYRPSVVNRLDRNTSGIILAAKTLAAAQMLSGCLRNRSVHKYYLALTEGRVQKPAHISAWLSKDPKTNRVIVRDSCPGQQSVTFSRIETEYIPEECFAIRDSSGQIAEFTLLRVNLITGKTHQIRSHLAFIGHPIIGDVKYGRRTRNEEFRRTCGLRRQFLHASEVVFPEMGGVLSDLSGRTFHAPLPGDLQKTLEALRHDSAGQPQNTQTQSSPVQDSPVMSRQK